jgi:hypothetical protein
VDISPRQPIWPYGRYGFDMVEGKMGQVKAADEVSQIRISAIIDEDRFQE